MTTTRPTPPSIARRGSRRPADAGRGPRAGRPGRHGAVARRLTLARAARELDELARICDATRKRGEAVAARRIAADLRVLA